MKTTLNGIWNVQIDDGKPSLANLLGTLDTNQIGYLS